MNATILAIGTELTSGQVPNTNATWISQRLKSHGISTAFHIVVPDDRDQICQALQLCEEKSHLIFVTGGLGPTSDDFTRELVTQWAQEKLVFNEDSWNHVQKRMQERNLVIHEFQKQQCYFPQSSQILVNAQGTANGFCLKVRKCQLWCLPGPPREVRAIWHDHIETKIQELAKNVDKLVTRAWQVLRLGEHQVAHLVEPLVQDSGLEVGYRVHRPYVEAKLTFPTSQIADKQKYIDQVETVLAPFTVARDAEDLAEIFCEKLKSQKHIWIEDLVTKGFLLQRLQKYLPSILKQQIFTYAQYAQSTLPAQGLKISCHLQDGFVMQLNITRDGLRNKIVEVEPPSRSPLMEDIYRAYYAEMIFYETIKSLVNTTAESKS